MKYLLLILLVLITFVSNAQIIKPDTLQLTPKELFGESDNWNDVGILQSYIDFSKDKSTCKGLNFKNFYDIILSNNFENFDWLLEFLEFIYHSS